ncbi:MAG: uncharacterized protein QOC92_1662 [Acidimicrobiaceae bacterium]|jgi:hypothetical protein
MDDTIIDDRVRVRVGQSVRGGRGVFASSRFVPGEQLDACPVLVVPASEAETVCATILGQYAFAWDDDGSVALALGTVSLLNHDADPNASYVRGDDADTMVVYASRVIEADDEILIDYTGGGALPLWFTPT